MKRGEKIRVVLLFGGRSAEHEVSLLSARNVLAALDRSRFSPLLIGIDRKGRWRRESDATLEAAAGDPRLVHLDEQAPVIDPSVLRPGDVVFPVLHGTYGEDGTIQGLLEQADVAYVGAGVLGSSVGMDKDVSKRLLRDAGIPIVDFRVVRAGEMAGDDTETGATISGATSRWHRKAAELGYPLFCKPANAGSSVGVVKVAGPAALPAAVRAALAFDRKVLLERAVDAREIECAVLGNDDPQASPPGEIVVQHRDGFYSYDAKYVDPDGASIRVPAALPDDVAARVRSLAIQSFKALELAGLARVDFFLDRGDGALYVNEVNTLPGFTAVSMYPKMWEAAGLAPQALVSRLIDLAQDRHAGRRALALLPP